MQQLRKWRYAVISMMMTAGSWAACHAAAIDNADCFVCHSDKELVKTNTAGKVVSLFVDETKFTNSIHNKNLCTACHTDITEVPHPDRFVAKAVSCSQCHRIETDIYLRSDHGLAIHKGVGEAASCESCHGRPHEVLTYRNPASPVYRTNIPDTCGRCHGNIEAMEKFKLRQRGVVVTYDRSVHGIALRQKGENQSAVCSDCHGTHDLHRATNAQSKLFWQNIPNTCGKCHDNVRQTYSLSVHGKAVKSGIRDAPVCTDCHGEHAISSVHLATSKVAPGHIPETCGQCHGAERITSRYELSPTVVQTYLQSFHGLAQQFGGLTAANCASCHGFHDILPSSDPLSSVHPKNLPQTCGKCHQNIGTRMARASIKIHDLPGGSKAKHWMVAFVSRVYVVIIVLTIGGMALHNLLDYLRKTRAHIRAVKADDAGETRLTRWMRAQHIALIVLFVLLAYTGFVHKFPDAWWSWPFRALANGGYWRGLLHRVAGWTFGALVVGHLVALFGTRRGHHWLGALWLRRHDLSDLWLLTRINLGMRAGPMPARRFNYIEKSEYWALLWGSAVMIVTGAMLIFTETVLRLLPKVWHDVAQVIHFYEAVLATLAIVVWHFYWVIFDPKEYPMNPAWLIGRKASHQPSAPENEPAVKIESKPSAVTAGTDAPPPNAGEEIR